MMRVQSACLEQTVYFDNRESYDAYLTRMARRHIPFVVISCQEDEERGLLVRLKKRYNHYDTGII